MIRTQIYIPEPIHNKLNRLAEEKGKPMAHIVREFIEEGLEHMADLDDSGVQTLERIVNLKLRGGPSDLSTNHDHYLYGGPKKTE